MEFRFLGKTGLSVSELCLGAMTFGREASEAESHAMLDRFVAAGGNFIDTADVYSRGASEEILRPLAVPAAARRSRHRHQAPLGHRRSERPPPEPVSGSAASTSSPPAEASLKRLKTDYIDLYQVHMWDPGAPLEETLEHARHAREERKGPLHRRQQLFRLAAAEIDRPREGKWLGAVHLPAGALQSPRPRLGIGAPACRPERRARHDPLEPASRRLARRRYKRGMNAPVAGTPHRDRLRARLERDPGSATTPSGPGPSSTRSSRSPRSSARVAGAGRAELAAAAARRHRPDHRRPQHDTARGQHRRDWLGALRRSRAAS